MIIIIENDGHNLRSKIGRNKLNGPLKGQTLDVFAYLSEKEAIKHRDIRRVKHVQHTVEMKLN